MKNKLILFNILLFSFVLIVFNQCKKSDNPKAVAEQFLKAMGDQDYEAAKKYGTEETERLLDMMSGFQKMTADTSENKMQFEIIRDKQEGLDNATIFYRESGHEGEMQLPMVKQDGKWKVLLTKESINSSEGMNSTDAGATSTDTTK